MKLAQIATGAALLFAAPSITMAQTDLNLCISLTDDLTRLSCYDSVFLGTPFTPPTSTIEVLSIEEAFVNLAQLANRLDDEMEVFVAQHNCEISIYAIRNFNYYESRNEAGIEVYYASADARYVDLDKTMQSFAQARSQEVTMQRGHEITTTGFERNGHNTANLNIQGLDGRTANTMGRRWFAINLVDYGSRGLLPYMLFTDRSTGMAFSAGWLDDRAEIKDAFIDYVRACQAD